MVDGAALADGLAAALGATLAGALGATEAGATLGGAGVGVAAAVQADRVMARVATATAAVRNERMRDFLQ
jgi:hypothetical protein